MPKTTKRSVTTRKINKSAWIRNQPNSMPAADVVSKAKEAGIKLSVAQVYTTRSEAKRKSRPEAAAAAAPRIHTSKRKFEVPNAKDLRHQFVSIAVRIGTDEAQRLLDRIVDVQTPMRGSAAF